MQVGLVGSSNNPVSGMAIATLIITAAIYKSSGATAEGMVSSIAVGTITGESVKKLTSGGEG